MKNLFLFIGLLSCATMVPQDIELELFATGLSNTVNIQHAGDNRLFVLDRNGIIRIVEPEGNVKTPPFLDIRNQVSEGQDERGLLGLAFHPNYTENGYFYINYVNRNNETIISRFVVDPTNVDSADPGSEVILITIPQPYANHNGGELVFGNDGMLFIALGDGGGGGDPQNRAQNLQTFFGKLLRIDVDNPSNGKNYGIPAENPFIDDENALSEIWAYGLRNP